MWTEIIEQFFALHIFFNQLYLIIPRTTEKEASPSTLLNSSLLHLAFDVHILSKVEQNVEANVEQFLLLFRLDLVLLDCRFGLVLGLLCGGF